MAKWIVLALGVAAFSTQVSAQTVERLSTIIQGKLSISGSTNRSAFSTSTLNDLCEQGYTKAIFTYAGAKPQTVQCSGGRTISYRSMNDWKKFDSTLNEIEPAIRKGEKVLIHCWYGVHASKFVASAALTRTCGFSGPQAAEYFKKGIPKGSLSQKRINELAAIIAKLSATGGVVQGCPSAN